MMCWLKMQIGEQQRARGEWWSNPKAASSLLRNIGGVSAITLAILLSRSGYPDPIPLFLLED